MGPVKHLTLVGLFVHSRLLVIREGKLNGGPIDRLADTCLKHIIGSEPSVLSCVENKSNHKCKPHIF